MKQRQLRLGDILDDYCPRERRLTNHVVVAMIGDEVKQTRCSTCEAEHEYKRAKLPRLRRKADAQAALSSLSGGPKLREPAAPTAGRPASPAADVVEGKAPGPGRGEPDGSAEPGESVERAAGKSDLPDKTDSTDDTAAEDSDDKARDEGPVHRPLIRASLPRLEGQPPPQRPATDFTIRQPTGRQNRFRPRHSGGGQQPPQGNRSGGHMGGGGGSQRGGMPRHGSGHSPVNRLANRHGQGRKRSK